MASSYRFSSSSRQPALRSGSRSTTAGRWALFVNAVPSERRLLRRLVRRLARRPRRRLGGLRRRLLGAAGDLGDRRPAAGAGMAAHLEAHRLARRAGDALNPRPALPLLGPGGVAAVVQPPEG